MEARSTVALTNNVISGVLALTADRDYPSSGCRGWIIDQLVVIEVLTLVVEIILVVRGALYSVLLLCTEHVYCCIS